MDDIGGAGRNGTGNDTSLATVIVAMAVACLLLAGGALWMALPVTLAAAPALIACAGFTAAFAYGGLRRHDHQAEQARAESEADLVWELQESVDHYRMLIDTLGDFVVHRDTSGRILFANEAFARFCDRDAAELAGKTFSELGISVEETGDEKETGGTSTLAMTVGETTRWLSWTTVLTRHAGTGDVIRQAIGRDRVSVVADVVGGAYWPTPLDALDRGGRYTCAGAIAGPMVTLDLRTFYLRDLTFTGATIVPPGVFADLVRYIERGEVKPILAARYPLAELREAQRAFIDKQHIGNIVVVP